jgi:two-component system, NarL family, sensor kinase
MRRRRSSDTQEPQSRARVPGVTRQVGQFVLAGLVAVAIVGLATAIASRRVGEREAIANARTTTLIKAQGLVEPALTDDIGTAASPASLQRLATIVAQEVLDDSLVRVKLWSADGTILFSDEQRLIGERFDLGDDEASSLISGRIEAEVSDLERPENRYERTIGGSLLEVYLPVHTPNGEPLLFEAYYRLDDVRENGSRLWRSFAPISLGALVMLELVQIPLAWSLARRLRRRLQERERLLQRALDASEVERRQIASDLHDGVVQELAGVAYALSARARRQTDVLTVGAAAPTLPDHEDAAIAETVRDSIKALRSLVIDLYPPNLREEGLESALQDLAQRTRDNGLPAEINATGLRDPLPDSIAGLLYRSAQEGLRNALHHSSAASVRVRVATENRKAVLEVIDDGQGFDAATLSAKEADGHVGLRALRGLVTDGGGTLRVRSQPGTGTTMTVEVPLP